MKIATGIKIARNVKYGIVFLPTTMVQPIDPITDELGIRLKRFDRVLRGDLDPSILIGKFYII